jgi:hypothetical protein
MVSTQDGTGIHPDLIARDGTGGSVPLAHALHNALGDSIYVERLHEGTRDYVAEAAHAAGERLSYEEAKTDPARLKAYYTYWFGESVKSLAYDGITYTPNSDNAHMFKAWIDHWRETGERYLTARAHNSAFQSFAAEYRRAQKQQEDASPDVLEDPIESPQSENDRKLAEFEARQAEHIRIFGQRSPLLDKVIGNIQKRQ